MAALEPSMHQDLAENAAANAEATKTKRAATQATAREPEATEAAVTEVGPRLVHVRAAVVSAPMGAEKAGTPGTPGTCISGSLFPGCFDTS